MYRRKQVLTVAQQQRNQRKADAVPDLENIKVMLKGEQPEHFHGKSQAAEYKALKLTVIKLRGVLELLEVDPDAFLNISHSAVRLRKELLVKLVKQKVILVIAAEVQAHAGGP